MTATLQDLAAIDRLTEGGMTFEQAMEIHRLWHEDCLPMSQITICTRLSLQQVNAVLTGRVWPGAYKRWDKLHGGAIDA